TKENNGDFHFPKSTTNNGTSKRRRQRTEQNDSTKLLLALLAGAGGAFLLAIVVLMSRLEAEHGGGGISGGLAGLQPQGAAGVDDQIYLEEVAQGHASPALMLHGAKNDRQSNLINAIERLKGGYKARLGQFQKLAGIRGDSLKDNPMNKIVKEAVDNLDAMEGALEGEGEMPKKLDIKQDFLNMLNSEKGKNTHESMADRFDKNKGAAETADSKQPPHLYPRFPPLPPHLMAVQEFGEQIITDTLNNKPTIAGIIAILQTFLSHIHAMEVEKKSATAHQVIDAYFSIIDKDLVPFERAYRGRPIFPIREDSSIFMSLGAYRDHLLGETLRQAFKNAKHPERLFVGAVVQNCFGIDVQCRTGVEVKGKDEHGNPITAVSDRPPDVNGIEQFCTDPEYSKYCDSGQIRALYVNETESNGPTTARYFASKLWGGETYFLQADAHLRFAPEWDRQYEEEVKAAKSYPKSVLSSYPPGFSEGDPPYKGGSKGTRLCTCEFSTSDVEHKIIRINTGNNCRGEEEHPTQIAYIAAGFFFARAEFLVDVPFDPFLPWCFMGEEIALSLRAWTHGWDIYAPRKNLIAHQYRPGRMGLPKFWENTGRVFGRPGPGFNTELQTITLQRIKHMVGYEEATPTNLENHGNSIVLTDYEHYGPGEARTMDAFLEHTRIDVKQFKCGYIDWCNECTLE
ncbi:hypothetical protein HJC23_004731, partial [Cyclotella cryptica]